MVETDRLALVVGIDDYPEAPLSCCGNDARDVATALEMVEYGFRTSLLLDGNATRREVLRYLAQLEEAPPSTFLFYFSGHGCVTTLGTYLVTPDGEPYNEGLELQVLSRVLENLTSKNVTSIVVLDCCHSGVATPWTGTQPAQPREIERVMPAVGKSRVVVAACRPEEFAYEDPSGRNSLFTSYLIRGLLGDAADQEGLITLHGLYDYVARPFERTTSQLPVFRADIEGRVVLARGFPPRRTKPLDVDENVKLIEDAQHFLEDYLAVTSDGSFLLEEWKESGFQTACKTLEPILRWFERQLNEHPDLKRDTAFMDLSSSAQSRLAQLCNLDGGSRFMGVRLVRTLGDGSFGTVWKAIPEDKVEKPVAYKVYHPHELSIAEKIARFERGHRAMKKLDHPNIVRVGEYTRCPVGFFMDYIDGPNLRELSQGLEEPADKIRLLITVAETLRHAHGRDVIHRDIKPENIVVEYDTETAIWRPYLTDFDLAWFSTATQFTKDAVGTTFYAAPEQLASPKSRSAHDGTVDIYAFGQLAYFLATGSDPVPLGLADNARALSSGLSGWGSEVAARQFYELYRDCSESKPKNRPGDFTAVLERLGNVLQAFREISETQELEVERFVKEIVYSLIGLTPERKSESGEFFSVSGRTVVSLHVTNGTEGRCRVTARLAPSERLTLEGVTNDRARLILNVRIDEAIKGLARVRRRSGAQGIYEVFLEFESVRRNATGVQVCRAALVRAIGAMERQ